MNFFFRYPFRVVQCRGRKYLTPHATKGFNPNKFEHMGEALRHARESKRIHLFLLGQATGIKRRFLAAVERGEANLLYEQRLEVEKFLGVPLRNPSRNRLARTP